MLAAKQGATVYASDRDGRIAQLQTQLGRIEALRRQIPAPLEVQAVPGDADARAAAGTAR